MARRKTPQEDVVGKRAFRVFNTQNAIRDLVSSGMSSSSPAYKKLRQRIKNITGKPNVLTVDPLDYSGKPKNKKNVSEREQIYQAYEDFAKSVTSTPEGIYNVQERNLQTARKLLSGYYGLPTEDKENFKDGLATGTEEKLLDLIKKSREQIGDAVFDANSDFIVNALVTSVLAQSEVKPLTYEEFLNRPNSKSNRSIGQSSSRLIKELKDLLPQVKDIDLKNEIMDLVYKGDFQDSYDIGRKHGLYD